MDLLPLDKKKITRKALDVQEYKSIMANEKALQRQCEEYLEWNHIPFVRVPDAIYNALYGQESHIPVKIRKFISSFIRGLPDLMIFQKGQHNFNHVLCVELKTAKGKMSLGQKVFARSVNVIIVRSFEDFCQQLGRFLEYVERDIEQGQTQNTETGIQ